MVNQKINSRSVRDYCTAGGIVANYTFGREALWICRWDPDRFPRRFRGFSDFQRFSAIFSDFRRNSMGIVVDYKLLQTMLAMTVSEPQPRSWLGTKCISWGHASQLPYKFLSLRNVCFCTQPRISAIFSDFHYEIPNFAENREIAEKPWVRKIH